MLRNVSEIYRKMFAARYVARFCFFCFFFLDLFKVIFLMDCTMVYKSPFLHHHFLGPSFLGGGRVALAGWPLKGNLHNFQEISGDDLNMSPTPPKTNISPEN